MKSLQGLFILRLQVPRTSVFLSTEYWMIYNVYFNAWISWYQIRTRKKNNALIFPAFQGHRIKNSFPRCLATVEGFPLFWALKLTRNVKVVYPPGNDHISHQWERKLIFKSANCKKGVGESSREGNRDISKYIPFKYDSIPSIQAINSIGPFMKFLSSISGIVIPIITAMKSLLILSHHKYVSIIASLCLPRKCRWLQISNLFMCIYTKN